MDDLRRRFLPKIAGEERADLGASHEPESARGRHSHRPLKVVQQIAQLRNHNRRGLGEPARVRANLRIIVAQQPQHRGRWQFGPKACGCGNGSFQTRPLNDPPGNEPSQRSRRIRAGDPGESINRGRLFGDDPIGTETGETAAQSFKSGDRGGHAPPPRFGGESETVRDRRMGQRSHQLVVFHGIRRKSRPRHLVRGRRFGRSRDVMEQIELMDHASRIRRIPGLQYPVCPVYSIPSAARTHRPELEHVGGDDVLRAVGQ
jgi:hypothetical protein